MVLYSCLVDEGFLKTSFYMTILTCLMPRHIKQKLLLWGQETQRFCANVVLQCVYVYIISSDFFFFKLFFSFLGRDLLTVNRRGGFLLVSLEKNISVKEQSQQELVWKTMLLQIVTNYLFACTASLEHCCSLICFCSKVHIFVNMVIVLRASQNRSIYTFKCSHYQLRPECHVYNAD